MSIEELLNFDSPDKRIFFDAEIYIDNVNEKNSLEEIAEVHLNEWILEYNIIYQSYILEN